jgi:hypothetical protein
MDEIGGRVVNASDAGLIVQGTLILLSAVVGVLGYVVSGRMKARRDERDVLTQRKEELRRMKLQHTRAKLGSFVGPCFQLTMNIQTELSYLETYMKERFPDAHRRYSARMEAEGKSVFGFYKGVWNKRWHMVPKEIEEELKLAGPEDEHFKVYVQQMRSLTKRWARPLADLINKNGQHLQHWGSKEAYKKRFPIAANNGALRNLFPTQLVRWTAEMEQIIEDRWDKDDFSCLCPVINPYPASIIAHFSVMITQVREEENVLGIGDHKVHEDSNEQVKKWEKGARERGSLPRDGKQAATGESGGNEGKSGSSGSSSTAVTDGKTSKQKYVTVAATAAGSAMVAVAASAVGQ